jgi:hypothetical protein
MASISTSIRKSARHSKRFPLDALNTAALVWSGAFFILAFVLGYWLR